MRTLPIIQEQSVFFLYGLLEDIQPAVASSVFLYFPHSSTTLGAAHSQCNKNPAPVISPLDIKSRSNLSVLINEVKIVCGMLRLFVKNRQKF